MTQNKKFNAAILIIGRTLYEISKSVEKKLKYFKLL